MLRLYLFILCFLFSEFACAQSFFTPTTYAGAFGTSDWTKNWTNWNPRNTSYPAGTTVLQGIISSNTTLTANKTYLLKGYVYVRNNATLTIEPGTVIRCDVLSSATLIITRGSKIVCNGTENSPIIFTSSEAAGSRTYGDWGGIVILGNAKINASGGLADVGAGINNSNSDGLFGGNYDEDSSGSITYTRIEFAGIQYQPDKEINGLNLGGVGSKTHFDFIQISYCGNDGIHIAGGTARLKHLIFHRGFDSDLTMDLGYRGLIQFAVVLRDSTKANASGVSGIEIQNDGLATSASPQTDPTLSNFTILGPLTYLSTPYNSNYRYAIHCRRNGKGALFNSAFAGYPKGLVFDGPGCGNQLNNNQFIFENNFLSGHKTHAADTTGKFALTYSAFDIGGWLNEPTRKITIQSQPRNLKLKAPYIFNSPEFIPETGSDLNNAASFSHIRLSQTEGLNFVPENLVIITNSQHSLRLNCTRSLGECNVYIYDLQGKLVQDLALILVSEKDSEIPKPACGLYQIVVSQKINSALYRTRLWVD